MKNIILKILLHLYRLQGNRNWITNKTKVLIYEPDLQRRQSFENIIRDNNINKDLFEFKIVSNRLIYLNYCEFADVIYCYSINKQINLNRIKLIYIGVVGFDTKCYNYNGYIINAPNFAGQYVADYVLAAVTSFERNIYKANLPYLTRKWNQKAYFEKLPKTFNKIKIGILGLGNIGSKIAKNFYSLGSEVHGYDVQFKKSEFITIAYNNENWHEMIKIVDYLVITIPGTKENENFIDAKIINNMNENLCIVNVSRGSIIDEKALFSALNRKRIRGAILDVFAKEPLPRRNKLWKLQNTIITPHISGNIQYVYEQIQADFIRQLKECYYHD